MHVMSALEYSFIAGELAPKLTGRHFGRIRKLAEGTYRLKVGTVEVICGLGTRMHETRYLEEGAEPDKFAEKISKELDNAKLLALEQLNRDRIIAFTFDRGTLVFEMFGDGNAVLVRDGKTICATRYEKWADREIKAGAPYSPPKNAPPAKLELSQKYVIVSLMKLPFGKDYALEALARAGIDEKKPGIELTEREASKLETELARIRSAAAPCAFIDPATGKPADFALTPLARYSKLGIRNFKTLSEAADEYYQNAERPNPELEKLLRRLEKQQERLLGLLEEEKLCREKGDFIYAHYQEVERLLKLAKEGKFVEIGAEKVDKKGRSFEAGIQ